MAKRLDITVHAVQGERIIPSEVTHGLSLQGNPRVMWELLLALAGALMGEHLFGDRHLTDPSVDLYVEVTYGLD